MSHDETLVAKRVPRVEKSPEWVQVDGQAARHRVMFRCHHTHDARPVKPR